MNTIHKFIQNLHIIWLDKTQVQFLRLGIGSPIEFKHMIVLTNETQTMLSFPRIFKFTVFELNQKPNVLNLRNCT